MDTLPLTEGTAWTVGPLEITKEGRFYLAQHGMMRRVRVGLSELRILLFLHNHAGELLSCETIATGLQLGGNSLLPTSIPTAISGIRRTLLNSGFDLNSRLQKIDEYYCWTRAMDDPEIAYQELPEFRPRARKENLFPNDKQQKRVPEQPSPADVFVTIDYPTRVGDAAITQEPIPDFKTDRMLPAHTPGSVVGFAVVTKQYTRDGSCIKEPWARIDCGLLGTFNTPCSKLKKA